jgi:hypothetical protein
VVGRISVFVPFRKLNSRRHSGTGVSFLAASRDFDELSRVATRVIHDVSESWSPVSDVPPSIIPPRLASIAEGKSPMPNVESRHGIIFALSCSNGVIRLSFKAVHIRAIRIEGMAFGL